jgi:Lrp/AsnC family leucine-responsive transcriptional regulator
MLDDTDLKILELIQANGRITNADLARELSMAPSAMLERVKKLEQKKAILQYTAVIDPDIVGQKLLAFILIRTRETEITDTETAAAMAAIPEVQEVHHIAGEDCFLVKVRTTDSKALIQLLRKIKKNTGVISTKTTIVLDTAKEHQQVVILKK